MWKKVGVIYTIVRNDRLEDTLSGGLAGGSEFFSKKENALKYKSLNTSLVEVTIYDFELKDIIPMAGPPHKPNLEKNFCTLAQDIKLIPWD